MRWILASDLHFGQSGTDYIESLNWFIDKVSEFSCDFIVLNGDIIHDDPGLLAEVSDKFKILETPVLVSRGNHDRADESQWESVWSMPFNYQLDVDELTILSLDTSNLAGDYLPPSARFLDQALDKADKPVLILQHIPDSTISENGVDTIPVYQKLNHQDKILAILCGHDHDLKGKFNFNGHAVYFPGNLGGSWGGSPTFAIMDYTSGKLSFDLIEKE